MIFFNRAPKCGDPDMPIGLMNLDDDSETEYWSYWRFLFFYYIKKSKSPFKEAPGIVCKINKSEYQCIKQAKTVSDRLDTMRNIYMAYFDSIALI